MFTGAQGRRREQSGEEGARGRKRPRVESTGVGGGGRKLTGSGWEWRLLGAASDQKAWVLVAKVSPSCYTANQSRWVSGLCQGRCRAAEATRLREQAILAGEVWD